MKAGVAMLLSEEVDVRARKIKGYREALHSDKGVSFPRRQINPKCLCN